MNWIERRQEYTATNALVQLYREAKDGVETRRKQLEDSGLPWPRCQTLGPGGPPGFIVFGGKGGAVQFKEQDSYTIQVQAVESEGEQDMFAVKVELVDKDSTPQSVLTVDGVRKEQWQVLYMALDKLLF